MTDNEVAAITRKAAERFSELGATVEEAHPDFSGLHDVFITLRTYDFFLRKAQLLRDHRDLLKPEVIWNIERGMKVTLEDMERAENGRVSLAQRYLAFFDKYDLLLTPATVVSPFPIGDRYVAEVNGPSSRTTSSGSRSPTRSRCRAARRCRCRAASRARICPSACRSPARRAAKRAFSPPQKRWRMFWACAERRRSTRGWRPPS